MADIETLGILEEIEALVSDKLQVVTTTIASPFRIYVHLLCRICVGFFLLIFQFLVLFLFIYLYIFSSPCNQFGGFGFCNKFLSS